MSMQRKADYKIRIAMIGGQHSPHYTIGLLSGLIKHGTEVDVVGNTDMRNNVFFNHTNLSYYDLRGRQDPNASLFRKMFRVLRFYFRLMVYTVVSQAKIFHIQWFDKLHYLEKILFIPFYRLMKKKVVFTAHNINIGKRDGNDSWLNRATLKFCYKRMDQLIVHTEKMRAQLIQEFKVPWSKISVIPHGLMSMVPITDLSPSEARQNLNIDANQKVILFFGNIAPYKGLDFLIEALSQVKKEQPEVLLLVVGAVKDCPGYWQNIEKLIDTLELSENLHLNISYIPDEDVEIYFKAADVLVLPYREIFQSGVLFLAYHFGIPIIATDVGSLKEDIIEGKTGFISTPEDPEDMARKISNYFQSELYVQLEKTCHEIKKFAISRYSWDSIGAATVDIYSSLMFRNK